MLSERDPHAQSRCGRRPKVSARDTEMRAATSCSERGSVLGSAQALCAASSSNYILYAFELCSATGHQEIL